MQNSRGNTNIWLTSGLLSVVKSEIELQNVKLTNLAKHLNVSKQYVSKLLNGKMTIKYFVLICEYLNLSIQLIPRKYIK